MCAFVTLNKKITYLLTTLSQMYVAFYILLYYYYLSYCMYNTLFINIRILILLIIVLTTVVVSGDALLIINVLKLFYLQDAPMSLN